MAKRKGWEYSLQIKSGVLGKDKKSKTYYLTLLETDKDEDVKLDDLQVLVSHKLLEMKYKYGRLAVIKYPVAIEDQVYSSGKAHRTKTVEVSKGTVVWQAMGYNIPEPEKKPKEVKKAA